MLTPSDAGCHRLPVQLWQEGISDVPASHPIGMLLGKYSLNDTLCSFH